MKNNILISVFFITMLLISSCSKDYLETKPTGSISEDDAFTTTSDVYSALNGIHRAMFMQYDRQNQAGQGSAMMWVDMLGEDVVFYGTGNGWWVREHRWSDHRNENSSGLRFIYRFYYKIIANANKIIANVDEAKGSVKEKNMLKGQAFAFRAWAHHQLVQLFAKRYVKDEANTQRGIVYMDKISYDGKAPSSVAEVYENINADIDSAIVRLNPTTSTSRVAKSHIDINVARGMKARIALTQGNWQVAADEAKKVQTEFDFMSANQHLEGYSNVNNPEWIWGSMQQDDQGTFYYSFFAFMSQNFSSSNIRGNPKLINSTLYKKIAQTDIRKQLWIPKPTKLNVKLRSNFRRAAYMNRKFLTKNTNFDNGVPLTSTSSVGDVPYMRVAEMYLIEAEALSHLDKDAEAAGVLFKIANNRDPNYTLSTKTGNQLLEEILEQRRIELWGEGFRFFDLKRLKQALNREGANHKSRVCEVMEMDPDDAKWVFFIPKAELNANKNFGAQNE